MLTTFEAVFASGAFRSPKTKYAVIIYQTCMSYFLLLNIKMISFWDVFFMDVNGHQNSLDINILQNNFYCGPQKNVSHTGLERHEGE